MAGPAARGAFRRLRSYSGRLAARLRLPATALTVALALANGGCATSGIVPMFGDKAKPDASDEIVTGSIKPSTMPVTGLPPEADLAFARAAVRDLLGAGRSTASAPWENPRTGARGTVTPIAAAYQQDGTTCRDFLASYVRDKVEAWMQGEACRGKDGPWEVKSLRPWKRS